MSEWSPISTVPRDRKVLLVCMKAEKGYKFREGKMEVDQYDDDLDGFGKFNNELWPPSHWMEIPDLPKVKK